MKHDWSSPACGGVRGGNVIHEQTEGVFYARHAVLDVRTRTSAKDD